MTTATLPVFDTELSEFDLDIAIIQTGTGDRQDPEGGFTNVNCTPAGNTSGGSAFTPDEAQPICCA
ncbi:hypothetical protein [Streptomyces sp. NPDC050548]|uniref:hypothetical protein n=1 Tax=Streptomyces sp. NPDC050548 TaxID=3365629 RepID=UPI0037A11CAF